MTRSPIELFWTAKKEISANLSVRNVEIKLDKYIVKIIKILVTSI